MNFKPIHRLFARLLLALAVTCTGCSVNSASTPSSFQPDWIETQMFFGLTEHGQLIPQPQWQSFVDQSITPRFPDGLTLSYAQGQYRDETGKIAKEPTAILILLHRKSDEARDDARLDAIAKEYNARFDQESVLRSDWPVQASFVSAR